MIGDLGQFGSKTRIYDSYSRAIQVRVVVSEARALMVHWNARVVVIDLARIAQQRQEQKFSERFGIVYSKSRPSASGGEDERCFLTVSSANTALVANLKSKQNSAVCSLPDNDSMHILVGFH